MSSVSVVAENPDILVGWVDFEAIYSNFWAKMTQYMHVTVEFVPHPDSGPNYFDNKPGAVLDSCAS